MGACCSGFGLNGNDNQKAKRRNSGFFLIEERPDTTTDEEKQKLKNNKNDKKSGAEADAGAPAGDARVFLRNCLLRGGIFTDEISFRQLTPEDVNRIVNNFEMKTFPTGTFLFHKGDYPCEVMHVAKRGLFRGVKGNIVKAIMKEGDLMGEIGFFHETPRLLSIMADNKGDCATYALHKWDWKVVAEKGRDLNSIRLLNDLTEEQKYQMKDKKELINMRAGNNTFFPLHLLSYNLSYPSDPQGQYVVYFLIVCVGMLISEVQTLFLLDNKYNDSTSLYVFVQNLSCIPQSWSSKIARQLANSLFSTSIHFSLHPGQYLFKKGDEIADFYLVLSGIMQVSDASIEELEGNSVPWNGVEGDELGKYRTYNSNNNHNAN